MKILHRCIIVELDKDEPEPDLRDIAAYHLLLNADAIEIRRDGLHVKFIKHRFNGPSDWVKKKEPKPVCELCNGIRWAIEVKEDGRSIPVPCACIEAERK